MSPLNSEPIILVPRRIVRAFPWINYEEYRNFEFKGFLKPSTSKTRKNVDAQGRNQPVENSKKIDKQTAVSISQKDYERISRYVTKKEQDAASAFPSDLYIELNRVLENANNLKTRILALERGRETAKEYQMLVLEVLNFLFTPELIDGRPEVKTIDGTERRDIIFTNDSDQSFWTYLRTEHSSILIMFEVKNTNDVKNGDIAQTATYMGARIGRLAFLVSRSGLRDPQIKKTYSVFNDSTPRKIIVSLSDEDLILMIDMKIAGNNPMRYVQQKYRDFLTSVQ